MKKHFIYIIILCGFCLDLLGISIEYFMDPILGKTLDIIGWCLILIGFTGVLIKIHKMKE